MPVLSIPVAKAKGKLEVDFDKLPDQVYKEILIQGAKVVLGRGMTKITKETYPDATELAAAALKKATETLEAMYSGTIRIMGAKADKVSGKVMTEARRMARQVVKDELKAAGHKVSHYAASEITKAANALIAADPSFIEKAKASLEALEKEGAEKADTLKSLISAIPVDEKKKAKMEAEAAERAATLSAIQAGKTKKRAKPAEATAQ